MHQFVDGEWVAEHEATSDDGEFERQETTFRDRVEPSDGPHTPFSAESSR